MDMMASKRSLWPTYLLWFFFAAAAVCNAGSPNDLSEDFYEDTCEDVKRIVKNKVDDFLDKDENLAGAFLRLHFHDCWVQGCDASLLLNSTAATDDEEIDAEVNFGLRGITQINRIKAAVEEECEGIVSCADIVALAASYAVDEVGGEGWPVLLGRRDGTTSSRFAALGNIPFPNFNYSQLVDNFAAKGFSARKMIVLSGSHTIGRAHCNAVLPHLYNFSGIDNFTDPTLDASFVQQLKTQCPFGNTENIVFMDGTKNTFDRNYYDSVLDNKGLFTSDAALITTNFGRNTVKELSDKLLTFRQEFAAAMVQMSKLDVLTGTEGQVRRLCHAVNT